MKRTTRQSTGRPVRLRIGLRGLLITVLVLGVLLGSIARQHHRAVRTARVLAELRGGGVVPMQFDPTWLGGWVGLLPQRARNELYASHGDRYMAFVGRPSRFSAVLIRRERLDEICDRLSRFEGIRSLSVPSGLNEAELGRIRSAVPDAEIVVDPRFHAARDPIRIITPRPRG